MYKNEEKDKLLTTIYRKPTDRTSFLDHTSAHAAPQLKNICSETSELNKHLDELNGFFFNRGYKENF